MSNKCIGIIIHFISPNFLIYLIPRINSIYDFHWPLLAFPPNRIWSVIDVNLLAFCRQWSSNYLKKQTYPMIELFNWEYFNTQWKLNIMLCIIAEQILSYLDKSIENLKCQLLENTDRFQLWTVWENSLIHQRKNSRHYINQMWFVFLPFVSKNINIYAI